MLQDTISLAIHQLHWNLIHNNCIQAGNWQYLLVNCIY